MSETLTMVNPIEPGKIRTHHAKIVVECTKGKPYYSIEWFDTAEQKYYLGYSSHCIDNVLGWLKESFEIVEAPKTNADRIRAMTDEEMAAFLDSTEVCEGHPLENCALATISCEACILKWLQQPAKEG